MLVGVNINTCCKAVGNELGRLANGIDNQVIVTHTIQLIRKGEVTRSCTVTYAQFLCDKRPLKSEPFRVRLTVGGYILEYPDDAASPAASILEPKLLFNSTISDSHITIRFLSCNLKIFPWKHPWKSGLYENSLKTFPTKH